MSVYARSMLWRHRGEARSRSMSTASSIESPPREVGWLVCSAYAFCMCWFVFHFACTAVYLLPVSELTARLVPAVSAYMSPYFDQRWSLFAPDPDGKTSHFQIACRLEGEAGATSDTALYDVSERFYANTWQTRLGPGLRVHRAYMIPTIFLTNSQGKLTELLRYQAKMSESARDKLSRMNELRAELGSRHSREVAQRIAAKECRRQFPDAIVTEVKPVVDIVEPHPFHLRMDQSFQPKSLRIDFGWLPAQAS